MPEHVPLEHSEGQAVESQATQQTGQRQVTLRVDEREMTTCYANAFRTNGMAEEVMLDLGINSMLPAGDGKEAQIIFKTSTRVIMNYYSAKRLALALGQVIRQHEGQFGELELDTAKRRKT